MIYNKLVRDKIPEIIESKGQKATIRTLIDEAEFKKYLEKKLDEEVAEFHESNNIEELADIIDVVIELCKAYGYKLFDLSAMREIKGSMRGGFEKRICLIEVTEQ